MNRELAAQHAVPLEETLGHPGRMISLSKTLYREAHPDHLVVFNSNVCLARGKIWRGDLDLTEDEQLLVELARRIGETVYVLYEFAGRFDNEDDPELAEAAYSVTADGHTRFQFHHHERRADGTLRKRPLPRELCRRWRWRVLLHRPRLLRFWLLERTHSEQRFCDEWTETTLVYLGARDRGRSWRAAPKPLLDLKPGLGAFHLWLRIWPGFVYELLASFRSRRFR
jgi:hypothetical protein